MKGRQKKLRQCLVLLSFILLFIYIYIYFAKVKCNNVKYCTFYLFSNLLKSSVLLFIWEALTLGRNMWNPFSNGERDL